MGGEIEEPDPAGIGIGGPGKIGNELDQRIGQLDGPCRRHMRQHLAGEGLGDRADAQQGGAVGRRTARAGTLAEAADRYRALPHRADHQGRDLGLDEQDLTGKIDNLVKHWVSLQAIGPVSSHARLSAAVMPDRKSDVKICRSACLAAKSTLPSADHINPGEQDGRAHR